MTQEKHGTRRARVMLVEDDQLVTEFVSQGLKAIGYDVVATAGTAEEALSQIELGSPDILVTDLNLSGNNDGIGLADRIFELYGIPSVFLTGHSDHATIESCRIRANFGYLVKPASVLQIDAALITALHQCELERRLQKKRRLLAEALKHESIFRRIVQQSSDGSVLVDSRGRVRSWNEAAASISGLSSEETIGRYVWQVLYAITLHEDRGFARYGDLRWGVLSIIERATQGEFSDSFEFWIETKIGALRFLEVSVYRIDIESGFMLGCAFRDRSIERSAADGVEISVSFLDIANNADSVDSLWLGTLQELRVLFPNTQISVELHGADGVHLSYQCAPQENDPSSVTLSKGTLPCWTCLNSGQRCLFVNGSRRHDRPTSPSDQDWSSSVEIEDCPLMPLTGSSSQAWALCFPVKTGESFFGNILIQGEHRGRLDPAFLDAIERGLARIAVAHERAVTREQLRDRNRELEALRSVSLLMNRGIQHELAVNDVLASLIVALSYDAVVLISVEGSASEPVVIGQSGIESILDRDSIQELIGGTIPLLNERTGTQVRFLERGLVDVAADSPAIGYRTVLQATIPCREIGCGLVLVALSSGKKANDPRKLQLIAAIGNQLQIGVRNVRLYDELRTLNVGLEREVARRTRKLEVVNAFVTRCGNMTQDEHVLFSLFEALASETASTVACAVLVKQGEMICYDWGLKLVDEALRSRLQDGAVAELPQITPYDIDLGRVDISPPGIRGLLYSEEIQHTEVYPFLVGEQVFGAVCIGFRVQPSSEENDPAFIRTLLAQSSESLHRIYRLEVQQQHRIEAMLQGLPVGVAFADEEGRIVVGNSLAREYIRMLSSIGAGERLGRTLPDDLNPSRWLSDTREFSSCSPAGCTIEINSRAVEEEDSYGWALVLRDVTTAREQLEQKMLQERLASVGQLAAGIAHDFNNILTGIIGYASYLELKEAVKPEARQHLSVITQQAHRAAQLVEQILDFARCPTKEYGPLSLVPLLKEILRFLRRTIPEDIEIRFNCLCETDISINGDPTQIQQVLTNLCLNARDAMPQGGELNVEVSKLTVSGPMAGTISSLKQGEWACLTVADTGTGMSAEVKSRILEPFYTTKDPSRGTGLGLPQAYGIVHKHGGVLHLDSRLGEGTRVQIYLPVSGSGQMMSPTDYREDRDATSHKIDRVEEPQEALQRSSVIIVEDQLPVLEVMRMVLEEQGYNVLTAEDGNQALEMYEQHKDEVFTVVTDLVMPGLGGCELQAELYARDPKLPVIGMSGYNLNQSEPEGSDGGFAVMLRKPLDVNRLATEVRKLNHRPAGAKNKESRAVAGTSISSTSVEG